MIVNYLKKHVFYTPPAGIRTVFIGKNMNKQNSSDVDILQSNILNEKDAAKYIGMSVSYLQKDRMNGAIANRTPGPKWIKVGKRVLYSKQALSEWLEEHTVKRSA